MDVLKNLKTFEDFKEYYSLNESLGDAGQTAINRAFLNMGDIPLTNGDVIRPRDIVKVVNDAIIWIATEFRTYYSFAKNCNIIYLVNHPDCRTMAVDQYMNMYMDVLFIYNNLKMDSHLVAAVIMHEIFHVVYNHIERGKNWLSANGRPISDLRDTNLAGDVEVNVTLTNKGIITEDELVNEIHGLFLSKKNGEKTNMPMEYILENEKLMEKLRSMAGGLNKDNASGNGKKEDTTEEWDKGYKDGWGKIADLLNKYGPEELIDVLREKGVILDDGSFNGGITQEDIDLLNFIQIKSMSEFLNESKSKNGEETKEKSFETYDQGYIDGVRKAIEKVVSSIAQGGGDNMPQTQMGEGEVQPNSKLTKDDLKELNLPENPNAKQDQQSSNSSFPENVNKKAETSDKNTRVGDKQKDSSGSNGKNNSSQESGDDQNQGKGSGSKGGDDQKSGKKGQDGSGGGNDPGKGNEQGSSGGTGKGQSNDDKQGGQQNGASGNETGGQNPNGDPNASQGNSGQQQSQNGQSGQNSGDQSGNNSQSSGNNTPSGSQSKGAGKGGQGVDGKYSDAETLANDLKDKSMSKNKGGGNPSYANKPEGGNGNSKDESIGGTGSFINDPESKFAKDAMKNSGYSDEDIKKILEDTIEKNKRMNSPEGVEEKRRQLYSKLSANDCVRKYLDEIEVSSEKYKNIWKKIMRKFLGVNNRKAGDDKMSRSVDWKSKRHIARGRLGVRHLTEAQEPQNINVYVDVSGSVNVELLEVICKSLAIFSEQYKYSGINIIPWASTSNGVHEVKALKKSSPEQVTKEILGYVSEGIQECGGGTDLLGACVPQIVAITEKSKKKDDKHIIITDGETYGEEKLEKIIAQKCNSRVVRNCFYMIYDASGQVRKNWESAIEGGTLLFIDSKVVIGNK